MLSSARYEGRPYFTVYEWRTMDDSTVDLLTRSVANVNSTLPANVDPAALPNLDPKLLANLDPASLANADPKSLANLDPKSWAGLDPKPLAGLAPISTPSSVPASPPVPGNVPSPVSPAGSVPTSAASLLSASIGSLLPKPAARSPDPASSYSNLTPADAVYTGSANALPIATTLATATRMFCPTSNTSGCYTKEVRCTTKTARFELSPRLTDVRRGKVVYGATKIGVATSSWCDDAGDEAADRTLAAEAMSDAFRQAREDVAPYEVQVAVKYKDSKDGLDPRSVEPFDRALAFARTGRFDKACPLWSSFAAANPASRALAFNVAACDEFAGRLDAALAGYQRVDEQAGNADPDATSALARVRERMAH
ncbi:hypothetical protein FAZ69_18000 [Trinickia terrae]|uniref:Tetratricopeptide repeat protein n=1 Tax=Trinickia terrae TaxID=2571161 RepID=A0A4U1I234_9BURK|nr:hypothetical protein [Trinickia terrae]TKC87226.1 hypothetical protein FAZ69_18000 [Trinickia terrae]